MHASISTFKKAAASRRPYDIYMYVFCICLCLHIIRSYFCVSSQASPASGSQAPDPRPLSRCARGVRPTCTFGAALGIVLLLRRRPPWHNTQNKCLYMFANVYMKYNFSTRPDATNAVGGSVECNGFANAANLPKRVGQGSGPLVIL